MLSVAVTTFNRSLSCIQAIESLLEQNDSRLINEIIVVDDASEEKHVEKLKESEHSGKFVLLEKPSNQGLVHSRNLAINVSKSEWFSFCDDDDSWHPDCVKNFQAALKQEAGDECGVVLCYSSNCSRADKTFLSSRPRLSEFILNGYTPPVSAQFYRRSLLEKVGGYNPSITSGVDHDLWIRLCFHIDPIVVVMWDARPQIGKHDVSRMTQNEEKRRAGIAQSLVTWESLIIGKFGDDFYHHFCSSYEVYLDTNFLLLSRKGKVDLFVGFFRMSRYEKGLVIRIFKKRIQRSINLFDRFLSTST